jgi:hypothetical protein
MAITAQRDTNAAGAQPGSALLSISMTDARHYSFTVALRVIPEISDAQVATIVTALEALSNGKACDWTLSLGGTLAGGKAAAEDATYSDKFDLARLKYASTADCTERLSFAVGAPKVAIFTGTEKRILNDANALVTALNAALADVLSSRDGNTAFVLDSGYRDKIPMPTPQL